MLKREPAGLLQAVPAHPPGPLPLYRDLPAAVFGGMKTVCALRIYSCNDIHSEDFSV